MFVKLNLLVICAVLLKFSECGSCDDVFKCVNNWVTAALSPNSNVTVEVIEDVAANDMNKSLDGSLLKDLSKFFTEKFSNLLKESPSLNILKNKTNIYVQTFKINESSFDNKSVIATTISKPDLIENHNNDKNTHGNVQNTKLRVHNITAEENVTPIIHIDNKTEIDNKYNATVTIQTMTQVTATNSNSMAKNTSNKNSRNITGNIQLEYSTYDTNFIHGKEETTTSISLKIDNIPQANDFLDLTTDKITVTEVNKTKTEIIKNSISGSLSKTNNISVEEFRFHVDKDDILRIKINDNYIDDVYDSHGDNEIDISEFVLDNLTDYLDIDYTDIYKDTTNEDLEYTPAVYIPTTTEAVKNIIHEKPTDGIDSVYPWIATVFVMNGESKQFEYICDGSLVSERAVLTAARCVMKANVTVDVANMLVILGKRSLQSTGPNEIVLRVKSIKVHENFVSNEGNVDNDLAIVILAEPVVFNDDVRPAPLGVQDNSSIPLATATTGWHVSGPLLPLYLGPQSAEYCTANTNSKNYLCATLGDSETTCPSYGGLLLERQDDNQWRVKGMASGIPTSEGVCFDKHLKFTKIENYLDWIMRNVKEASSK